MRVDLRRLHQRAARIFDQRGLANWPYRMVAFVLDEKARVISEGWNQYTKTHPAQKEAATGCGDGHKHFLHAEIHALTRLGRKHQGRQHSIVVLRLGANKELKPGEPCRICKSVIKQYGIGTVIHS